MTATSTTRGNPIHFDESKQAWLVTETGEKLKDAELDCTVCKQPCPLKEPDPCLGELPGVRHACCGHGDPSQAYIVFENGIKVTGFKVEKPDLELLGKMERGEVGNVPGVGDEIRKLREMWGVNRN